MEYLHNDCERFKDAIDLTAYQTGVSPDVIEKDYYVTMMLRGLAEKLPFIVFKGGTSLSKCHGLIKRFSEDIDITIDTALSQGQKKKVKEAIVEIVQELGLKISNLMDTRSRRDYNCYMIEYNSVTAEILRAVRPTVIVETSYMMVSFPTICMPVHNYIGKMMETEAPDLIKKYELQPFYMKVQDISRTLADKVFAICDYYLQNNIKRHSRHIYDVYKLLPLVELDDVFHRLVFEVREVRSKNIVICPSASSKTNITKLLKKIIDEEVYKADYQNLTQKLLEEKIPYERAIKAIKAIIESGVFDL